MKGKSQDRGVFRNLAFNKALERGKLEDPAPLPTSIDPTWLNEQNDWLPTGFANDAFFIERHCMKPYENALDRESVDGSVPQGSWRTVGTNFPVNVLESKNNHENW